MRTATGLWKDLAGVPDALAATLDAADGVGETAAVLARPDVRRVVATGNGAAYYVAHALWLASLESRRGPEVVAVPGGLVARGAFPWREGDALLAVSSSGEFRDVVEAIAAGAPRPLAAITAHADSSIGRAADARALQTVHAQTAVTHTQAFANGVALALAVWAEATGDRALADVVAGAPEAARAALAAADAWAAGPAFDGLATPAAAVVFGSGPAWAAALEAALLLKEVARIPAEGAETREGATSAMYALAPGHLVLSLQTAGDAALDEADALCRRAGATVLRAPGGELADRRLAPITTFPAATAVAIALAEAAGHDVDHPAWTEAYYATARGGTT
jgi:fructoselysine-6-P-deglycase FrlB-like protein